MKKSMSVRTKITLWFSAVLAVMVALTFLVILSVGRTVVQRIVKDNLIELVEDNVGEVEYHASVNDAEEDSDRNHYIPYQNEVLEIDNDFLDEVNGITAALYTKEGELLYGENPAAALPSAVELEDGNFHSVSVRGAEYFVFDRQLTGDGLEGLWLRGVVSKHQEDDKLSAVASLSLVGMPLLLFFAIAGGYIIAGRALRPIKQITAAATEIGNGRDLKKRIAIGPGNDELHRLANTFDEMFERLDRSFEAEQQFTSDASHELRTPVSVIRAQCEYTLEKDRSPEEYREALEVISRQSGKMSRLVEDMLSLTRLERKAENYPLEPLDFSALVKSLSEDLALLREKNIVLTCEAEEGIKVNGNHELLSRLLTNLVGNAYRYGHENGHIYISLRRQEGSARLVVDDDGIGISPEQADKIFDRFYQADSSRSNQGTGLGLSMAQEIARIHGGSITVESNLGKGSKFIFKIPEKN